MLVCKYLLSCRLRNLSQDGCTQPSIPAVPRYQLADHRYGREEMLALFDHLVKAPDPFASVSSLYVEKTQEPLALQQMTEDETVMLQSLCILAVC